MGGGGEGGGHAFLHTHSAGWIDAQGPATPSHPLPSSSHNYTKTRHQSQERPNRDTVLGQRPRRWASTVPLLDERLVAI